MNIKLIKLAAIDLFNKPRILAVTVESLVQSLCKLSGIEAPVKEVVNIGRLVSSSK